MDNHFTSFLTTTDKFRDENGVMRWDKVSWPVFYDQDDTWIVLDVDGTWFHILKTNAIVSSRPSKLANLSDGDYLMNQERCITDYQKAYLEEYGIDITRNEHAEYRTGFLDPERKKELINDK